MGRFAAPGGIWRTPSPWALLLATVTWILTMLRNAPCIQTEAGDFPDSFAMMCYSDISVLYQNRGLSTGSVPLVDIPMEYPVLTTWLMEIARIGVNLLGGNSGSDATAWEIVYGTQIFYSITAVMMFVCFLGLVVAHLRLHRPWDALLIAASPLVVAGGLINWDMLVIFLAAFMLVAWSREKVFISGILLGLAVAAKLYPVFWLLPLFVLCLRTGKIAAFTRFCWGALLSWLAINLPMYVVSPSNWLNFWTFNVDRGPDLGSLWYVLHLAGFDMSDTSRLVTVLLGVCGVLIGGLMLLSPRKPRLAQGLFLITIVFLIVNKVYSPQYMLWLLPLLVLVRPKGRELVVFTVIELGYWAAIWGHLAQQIGPPNGGPDRLYWAAVILRVAMHVWLAALVVRDVLQPRFDPIRASNWSSDDPDGGVLDQARDQDWVQRLRSRLRYSSWPEPTVEPVNVSSDASDPSPGRTAV